MTDRDLDITKFSFRAYRKLKKTLGEFDAVIECNEIAIKEFLEKIERNDNEFIKLKELSLKHRVKVDKVDFLKFKTRIRQYYIMSVSQQAEQFFKDFKEEWSDYFPSKNWTRKNKGETYLQYCIINLKSNLPLTISNDMLEIFEYYRLIRNYMVHNNRDIDRIKKKYEQIKSNDNDFLKILNINHFPNVYNEINFDDFLILTNITKHIAYSFSTSSKPENQRIGMLLFEIIQKEDKGNAFKGLKKLKNDPVRYDKAIKSYIKTKFGRFSKNDESEVTEVLKSLLA